MSLNSVNVMGNLTRDPELKYTASGRAVCNLAIANNRVYSKTGEKVTEVSYFDVEVWGVIAENCAKDGGLNRQDLNLLMDISKPYGHIKIACLVGYIQRSQNKRRIRLTLKGSQAVENIKAKEKIYPLSQRWIEIFYPWRLNKLKEES